MVVNTPLLALLSPSSSSTSAAMTMTTTTTTIRTSHHRSSQRGGGRRNINAINNDNNNTNAFVVANRQRQKQRPAAAAAAAATTTSSVSFAPRGRRRPPPPQQQRQQQSYACGGGGGATAAVVAFTTGRRTTLTLNNDGTRRAARLVGAAAAAGASSGGGGGDGSEEDDDPLVDNVERAAKLLDTIIQETVEQIFVEEAVEEVIPGDGADDEEDDDDGNGNRGGAAKKKIDASIDKEAVLRAVVLKHLDEFDGSFMAAISAYVQVAESSGDFGLLSLLAAIREEVLAAVSGEMQPDIQVVQLVARLASKEDRLEVLRAAHRGGGKAASRHVTDSYGWGFDIPAAPIEKVENASARLIDEMELQEHVPNWQLLYQLLLVRETSRQLHPNADDVGVYGTTIISSSFSPSEIPKAEAALIKELCVVNEPLARRAFIMDKFEQCRELDEYRDADGGKVKLKRTARGFTPRREDLGEGEDGGMDVFDVRDIRPGRLIDCVINMRVALQREQADPRIIDRLSAMYFEACDVVLEQADKGVKKAQAEERALNELGD